MMRAYIVNPRHALLLSPARSTTLTRLSPPHRSAHLSLSFLSPTGQLHALGQTLQATLRRPLHRSLLPNFPGPRLPALFRLCHPVADAAVPPRASCFLHHRHRLLCAASPPHIVTSVIDNRLSQGTSAASWRAQTQHHTTSRRSPNTPSNLSNRSHRGHPTPSYKRHCLLLATGSSL